MSFFEGKKQTVQLTPDKEKWQLGMGEMLSDWSKKYMGQYQPGKEFTGQRTAQMAPGEVAGQDWLQKFLAQPDVGEGYGLAMDELKKTMTGGYDPFKSDYYKSMREGAGYELESAIDVSRRGAGARGSFFTDTAMREESNMRLQSVNYLNQLLGGLAEKERGRRWEGVGKAMELEKYKTGMPLEKAKAGTTLGSLPRLVEQADLEAKYEDFMRKQQELGDVSGVAQGVFGTPVTYGAKSYTQTQSSPFERIMAAVGPMIGAVAGSTGSLNPMAWFSGAGTKKTNVGKTD